LHSSSALWRGYARNPARDSNKERGDGWEEEEEEEEEVAAAKGRRASPVNVRVVQRGLPFEQFSTFVRQASV